MDLEIADQDYQLDREAVGGAKSSLLPQLDVSATLQQVDPDAIGQPERSGGIAGTASQIIYSEGAFANWAVRRHLEAAARHKLDLVAQDLVLSLASAYFNVLLSKTTLGIQGKNLEATRLNLETSTAQNAAGHIGRADVFRWESEVASATQSVIESGINFKTAKLQLSQLLNRPDVGEAYDIRDVSFSNGVFKQFDPTRTENRLQNTRDFGRLTDFMVAEAHMNMPSVKQLEANILAVNRQHQANVRSYYLPTISVQGQIQNTFWRDFGGANVPAADLLDFTWNVGLAASYPLFSGGKKAVDVRSSRIQQRQIRLQLDNIKQQLELAVRARALALMSKATNIHFAKVAGNTAQESYELTLDAYRKGQVSLTQLVDAQSAAFAAQEAQANATYQYLIALFELENVVGSYTMLKSPEDLLDFDTRLDRHLSDSRER